MLPFALIWGGYQGVHEATAFPKPRVLTYAQFEKERPKEGWFTITAGGVSPMEASWMVRKPETSVTVTESGNKPADSQAEEPPPSQDELAGISELYLPVRGAEEPFPDDDRPVYLVLQTHSEHTIHSLQQMAKAAREKGESGYEQWVRKNVDRAWERRSFTGMLQVGINASSNTREELAKGTRLDPNYVILKEGERPHMGFAATMLGAGVAMLLIPVLMLVAVFVRGSKGDTARGVDEFVLPGSS
jgi:hypothetical protein